jgi:multidrug transporter EmrE-like cation transporter
VAWVYVATTVVLTVYTQLIVKWQVHRHGAIPATLSGKVSFFTHLLLNPWVISVIFAAFIAALSWMAAMSRLPLSRSYPVLVGTTFVLVVFIGAGVFNEGISPPKVVGAVLIVAGLIVGSHV